LPSEPPRYAILKNAYGKGKMGLRFFMRGKLSHTGSATCELEIPEAQQSFRVRPFVDTNVWAVIPEDIISLKPGDPVEIYQ
jgi:molybdopterin molybdotransferase